MPADRFFLPFGQVFDATPTVRSGGKLYFYAAGTSTLLATYSDKDLSSANTNPVILNALGQAPNAIFLQNLSYKVVLKDANDVEIWTTDSYYGAQFSTTAKLRSGSGSPNGAVAGTAGSGTTSADVYWDYTNAILYICTTTGTSSTAVWTALNAGSASAIVPEPQGRLSLTVATPVTTSDVTGATAIYYVPSRGSLIPIYNGSSFTPTTFAELTLSLVAAHAANTLYDIFVFNNSGVPVVVTGPAWPSDVARGTGAGTTELTRVGGIPVNAVSMTGRNGSTTYSIGANQATYVGTFRTTGSTGTTEDSFTKRLLWNCYDRRARPMAKNDATATWVYSTATFRQANGSTANELAFVIGLSEDKVQCLANGQVTNNNANANVCYVGIGLDSTTADSSTINIAADATFSGVVRAAPTAEYKGYPGRGYHRLVWLERGGGADIQTWTGTGAISRTGITADIVG